MIMSCWQHNKVTHFERKIAVYFKKLNTFSHRIQQFHFLLITQEKKKETYESFGSILEQNCAYQLNF